MEGEIARLIEQRGHCIHVAVHSFTPVLAGKRRNADIGLLYDPASALERRIVTCWQSAIRRVDRGPAVRRNYPYRGTTDGLTTTMRNRFDPDRYAGIELELNQARLSTRAARGALAKLLCSTLDAALAASETANYCAAVCR